MIDLLEPAVAADPGFLDAQVLLAEAYGRMTWLNADPGGRFAAKARQTVADIAQRWPDRPQTQIAQGQLAYNLERDYAKALTHFEVARTQLPNDPTLLASIGACYKRLLRNEAFLSTLRKVFELDPESPRSMSELVQALLRNQRLDEAAELAERARARFPDDLSIAEEWMITKLARNQDINAVLEQNKANWHGRDLIGIARYVQGDHNALRRPIQDIDAGPYQMATLSTQRAELLQLAGRDAEAKALLVQLSALRDPKPAASGEASAKYEALVLAISAAVLALNDERELARTQLTKAQAASLPPPESRFNFDMDRALAERRLGNHEAAWLLIQAYAGDVAYLSNGELLAFKLYYDKVYGESPSYRAYMTKIAGQKKK